MKRVSQIQLLGDSILKGIQVEPATGRYVTRNEIGIPGLERDFGLTVKNGSHFGATVVKGERLLERLLERETPCDAVVMDFGGNGCDFRWDQVAADPEGDHRPNVPLEEFLGRYREMIAQLRLHGITPVLTTLPPLEPERFFHWWCGKLDQAAVRRWLGSLTNIYAHQENYSRAVEQLARQTETPLVDIRGAFLAHGHLGQLLCEDGTHPNSAGQALIGDAFRDFALEHLEPVRQTA